MKIAIIGTGNVGGALARGFGKTSHHITLGTRKLTDPATRQLASDVGAELGSPDQAARSAELIVLALPWNGLSTAIKALGDLSGKVVIDCTNPLGMVNGALGLTVGHTTSGG